MKKKMQTSNQNSGASSSFTHLEIIDSGEFGSLPFPEEIKTMVPFAASTDSASVAVAADSCNLGLPFNSNFHVSSNLKNQESSLSLEDLDFFEGQLFFKVHDSVSQVFSGDVFSDPNQEPILETHFDNQFENYGEIKESGFLGENKGSQIATVSVDVIQNRRPFKCLHLGCDKTFKNSQTLRMHYKTHCSVEFSMQRTPQAPKAGGHNNKKVPCRCPICGRTFVGLYELRRHFGRKHSEGEKMHNCKKCGKKFYIDVDLRNHERLCGEPAGCKCGMKFAFKCNLVAHRKSNPECIDVPQTEDSKCGQGVQSVSPATSNGFIGDSSLGLSISRTVKLEDTCGLLVMRNLTYNPWLELEFKADMASSPKLF